MNTLCRYELGDKVKLRRHGLAMEGIIWGRTFARETQYDVLVKGKVHASVRQEDLEAA